MAIFNSYVSLPEGRGRLNVFYVKNDGPEKLVFHVEVQDLRFWQNIDPVNVVVGQRSEWWDSFPREEGAFPARGEFETTTCVLFRKEMWFWTGFETILPTPNDMSRCCHITPTAWRKHEKVNNNSKPKAALVFGVRLKEWDLPSGKLT
jgi:hypothetical protein